MINPLVPNFHHLKEIFFRFQINSEGIDTLIAALEGKVDHIGRCRFFSKDKDSRGKWVIPGFSGFYISEKSRVEIILIGEKGKPSLAKKIHHAVHLIFTENGVHFARILLKKLIFNTEQEAKNFLKTQNLHIQVAIRYAERGQLQHRPDLLRVSEKKNGKIKIEIKEPKCDFDLIEWQDNFRIFLNGMIRVANYLIDIREKGYVHRDVKRGNVLIHQNIFYLSDFKLCVPIGTKREPEKYFAWDSTAERLGIFTPFCDVYGWAIAFASSLWDVYFYNLALDKEKLHKSALEEEIWKSLASQKLVSEEMSSPEFAHHLADCNVQTLGEERVHFLFYRFLKKILACDQALLKFHTDNTDQKNSPKVITLEDCILFVHELNLSSRIS